MANRTTLRHGGRFTTYYHDRGWSVHETWPGILCPGGGTCAQIEVVIPVKLLKLRKQPKRLGLFIASSVGLRE